MPSVEILGQFEKSERPEIPTHTPGPWSDVITEEGSLEVRGPLYGARYGQIAYVGDMENTEGEDHANARLMAAAPDLLLVCQALVDAPWPIRRADVLTLRLATRAAIAKATR